MLIKNIHLGQKNRNFCQIIAKKSKKVNFYKKYVAFLIKINFKNALS